MENHLYHPNMEGKACGLGRHTKRPVRPPYRNPRSGPPPPRPPLSPLLFQASVSCLPFCGESDSTGLGCRSGLNKKWKLLPRKVSEELTSDGQREGGSRRRKMRSWVRTRRMPAAAEEGVGGLGCTQKGRVAPRGKDRWARSSAH